MPAQRIKLIVNADDLGLSQAVNQAIEDVFRAGNLCSATLMVEKPGTQDAVRRLTNLPGLSVGLHFNITEGKALTGTSSFTDPNGALVSRGELLKRAIKGKLKATDIRNELITQIDRMHSLGVSAAHVDSHQHAMMIPAVFAAVEPILRERKLPVRVVRPTAGAAWKERSARMIKQLVNQRFASSARKRGAGLRMNDRLVSIHDLPSSGPYTAATYNHLIEQNKADEVVELMVHPYIVDDEVKAVYAGRADGGKAFLERCVAEHEALSVGPIFRDHVLIRFQDIP